jgi:hypothetical protein
MAYPPDAKPLPSEDLCNKEVPNPIRGKGPLEKGDSRKDLVEQLQKMLEFLEYSCGPQGADGIFGDNTRKALLEFQSEHKDYEEKGLKQDGKVGPRTSDALNRCLVGKWFGKWPTPKDFITKDKDIREKFLLLTITQEELKKGEALDTTPEKNEEIKRARVAVVDYAYEEVTLGIGLTPTRKDWWPDARNGENLLSFTARIYVKKEGKWIYPGKKRRIIFRLDSSREKGICMNFPKEANTNPDLFFAEDSNQDFTLEDDKTEGPPCPTQIVTQGDNPAHRHHYQKMKTNDMITEATAKVRCEDFGAYGFLEAFIDEGKELPPPAESDPVAWDPLDVSEKKVKVKIPWDKNGNDIADSAPQDDNGAPPDTDNDSTPRGDGTPGDGLTNFEEYRGFIAESGNGRYHLRTKITEKDIFIRNLSGEGVGHFTQTGLTIHLIPGPEFYNGDSLDNDTGPDPDTQVINFNQTPDALKKGKWPKYGGMQHGIRLVKEKIKSTEKGFFTAGRAFGGPGTPGKINRVALNLDDLRTKYPPKPPLPIVDRLTAHELGHAVNIWHHGEEKRCTTHSTAKQYAENQGGTCSGDVQCVMRYWGTYSLWCHQHGNPPSHCSHPIGLANDTPGTTFCSTGAGTGLNVSGGHNNEASRNETIGPPIRGNCRSMIHVKDWKKEK